jgi:hypothetical protein
VPNGDAQGIVTTLTTYFGAINKADWHTAWLQFTPDEQQVATEAQLAQGDQTSYDFDMSLISLRSGGDPYTGIARVTFTSVQSSAYGPNGDRCDHWQLDYTMRYLNASWLIGSVNGPPGQPSHTAC